MKSIFILFQILAISRQISGENILWQLLAKPPPPTSLIPNICSALDDWNVIADPQNCQKFYGCINNITQHLECPENYFFNSLTMHCMPGNCQLPAIKECEANELLPVTNDCQKFTFCKQGKRELYHCPMNQFFHTEMSVCLPKPDSPDAQCRCGNVANNNIFANPNNCETYYTCVNGKAVLIQCPKGEYFNTDIKSCVIDVDAVCLEEPTMSPPVSTQNYELCDSNDISGTVFFSSPTDCKSFFICVRGQLLIQRCAEGLYFDDEQRFCRSDNGQACKKRQIIEDNNSETVVKKHQHHNLKKQQSANKKKTEHMNSEVENVEESKRKPTHSTFNAFVSKYLRFF